MTSIPQDGLPAPDFTLPADDGNDVALQDFRGKILVLYFYPKDDTSGCTREAIDFTGLKDQFAEQGASILGVSADTPAKHQKFKQKHDLKIALASDEEHEMLTAYGVWKEKNMYGRKFMGIERSTFLIDAEGRITRVWRKVKVAGHAEEVLTAVIELAAK